MKSLHEQIDNYNEQNKNKLNQLPHYVGVPAIIIGSLILLSWFSIGIFARWNISFAWIATILALVYYYLLDIKLAAAMTAVLFVTTVICSWLFYPHPTTFSFILFVILFFGGFVLQFIGNPAENRKAGLACILNNLLIAPMALLIEGIKTLNLEKFFNLEK